MKNEVDICDNRVYKLGEFHAFEAAGARFLYLVAGGAIFEIDRGAGMLIERMSEGEGSRAGLLSHLVRGGMLPADANELIDELAHARVIVSDDLKPEPLAEPPADFPLQTLVLNLTNQCNLSCQYCYEFGSDKVATPQGKPKFMNLDTAKASVDFLLKESIR